jgi:hypothetical protein
MKLPHLSDLISFSKFKVLETVIVFSIKSFMSINFNGYFLGIYSILHALFFKIIGQGSREYTV